MPRLGWFLLPLLLAACSFSTSVGAGGVGVGASAAAAPANEQASDATCMYDRTTGELRTCLHFSFGRCAMFGDRCSREDAELTPPARLGP